MPERDINNLPGDFSICFSEHLTGHPIKFINNGAGFYKTIWKGGNIETVVIDTLNKKFLYCYCFI